MTRIPLLLFGYPLHRTAKTAALASPVLFAFLASRGVQVSDGSWNGFPLAIPRISGTLIEAPYEDTRGLHCTWLELAEHADRLGHIVFHNDHLVTTDGLKGTRELILAVDRLLRPIKAAAGKR